MGTTRSNIPVFRPSTLDVLVVKARFHAGMTVRTELIHTTIHETEYWPHTTTGVIYSPPNPKFLQSNDRHGPRNHPRDNYFSRRYPAFSSKNLPDWPGISVRADDFRRVDERERPSRPASYFSRIRASLPTPKPSESSTTRSFGNFLALDKVRCNEVHMSLDHELRVWLVHQPSSELKVKIRMERFFDVPTAPALFSKIKDEMLRRCSSSGTGIALSAMRYGFFVGMPQLQYIESRYLHRISLTRFFMFISMCQKRVHIGFGPEQALSPEFRALFRGPEFQRRLGIIAIDECRVMSAYPETLFFDSTYKTNMYKVTLLHLIRLVPILKHAPSSQHKNDDVLGNFAALHKLKCFIRDQEGTLVTNAARPFLHRNGVPSVLGNWVIGFDFRTGRPAVPCHTMPEHRQPFCAASISNQHRHGDVVSGLQPHVACPRPALSATASISAWMLTPPTGTGDVEIDKRQHASRSTRSKAYFRRRTSHVVVPGVSMLTCHAQVRLLLPRISPLRPSHSSSSTITPPSAGGPPTTPGPRKPTQMSLARGDTSIGKHQFFPLEPSSRYGTF
ncbi:hypothetical protein EJ06DRAFT_524092 [Trichodelitschia bisporula]|uniref:Uncharacterized protein n=1 Tax=Trichodelitschia bisporula TaxID=703511 RepID=A0A6G1HLY3_9PEZI|nr:hypothetical protein EJ06DRAFT_524092 [Trichodelitschia bisporula]